MDMLTKIALNDFPLVTHFPYIVISTSGGNKTSNPEKIKIIVCGLSVYSIMII